MRTGIMSMQRIVNYGSYLQAYGLKAMLESMGHHVEYVDYLPEPPLEKELPETTGQMLLKKMKAACKMLSPNYWAYRAEQIRMNQTFGQFRDRFVNAFLPELGISEQRNYCPELDALIIGSDEVFNCTQPGESVGYSLQLFGKDHRAKRILSYAASFGSTTMEIMDRYGIQTEIAQYLNRFNYLSVRDENSAEIVTALCGKVPEQHIDPVLLYDFPEVDGISVPLKDYIVVYAYAGRINEEETRAIRTFAEKRKKQVISLGFYQPCCDTYILATPLEVLAYVKHADYIITDTFHGSIFSIKYQVPFAALIRDSNRQKLGDLLKRFDLERRSVTALADLDSILTTPLDKEHIRTALKTYQNSAKAYLKNSLQE